MFLICTRRPPLPGEVWPQHFENMSKKKKNLYWGWSDPRKWLQSENVSGQEAFYHHLIKRKTKNRPVCRKVPGELLSETKTPDQLWSVWLSWLRCSPATERLRVRCRSGHKPGLRVRSLARACCTIPQSGAYWRNKPMLLSGIKVSLSPCLSKSNENKCPQRNIRN